MKITFLLHNAYTVGGTARATNNLAAALATRHEVEIVSYYRTADRAPLATADGVRTRTLVDLRPHARRTAFESADQRSPGTVCPHDPVHAGWTPPSRLGETRLAAHLRSTDADVVIATRPYLVCFLAQHGRTDYLRVGREHAGRDAHGAALLSDLDAAIARLDAYVTLSQGDERAHRAALRGARTRVTGIPVCCPAPDVEPSTGDSRIVLAGGRLTPVKRHDRLVDAFAEVAAVHPDWSLRIYGRGRERLRLRRRIEELGLHNNVLLMGARTPMEPEWAKGALAVVSSSGEPSGMSVVEAMSCGLPVVSTDCDHAPREIITHGEDGLLVPDHGPVEHALADALCRLIENEAERGRMAAAARRNTERFRPEHIAAQYEALFADLGRRAGIRRPWKSAAGPRRRTLPRSLGMVRLGRPVTVSCRVLPGGSLAFETPADQLAPRGRKLILKPRNETDAGTPRLLLEQPGTAGDDRVRAILDKRHWELAEGDWDVYLGRTGGGSSRPVRAGLVETARLLDPAALRPAHAGGRTWIPYSTEEGGLAVRSWLRPAHAEVSSVEVDDKAIRLTGALHGSTARAHHYRFMARIQGNGGHLVDAPCPVDQYGGFHVTLPVDVVAELHSGGEALWDLGLSAYGGPEIRLAMVTGDLVDRRDVCVFPAVRCAGPDGGLTLRPQLTRDHDLVLRTADAVRGPDAHGGRCGLSSS
ncbi:glycosyltransferase [Streptomyces muensis]|uniref:D-inositol 3-phosphate glycosyltransferase n=1 Tax=Streptomyces muensis TaxID=1077944 RepID=A0A9X1Q0W0_STRM4|nr:glycosyltransferase [Streptomyces muensis]MCF1596573.1 glycosyltransferase [Streptomyces muensis]